MWWPIQMLQNMENSRYISAVKQHNEMRGHRRNSQENWRERGEWCPDERQLKPDDLTVLTQEWSRARKKEAQKLTHWQLGLCQCPLGQPQISRQIFVKLWSGIKIVPCGPGSLPHTSVSLETRNTERTYTPCIYIQNIVFLAVRKRLCIWWMFQWMEGRQNGWIDRWTKGRHTCYPLKSYLNRYPSFNKHLLSISTIQHTSLSILIL